MDRFQRPGLPRWQLAISCLCALFVATCLPLPRSLGSEFASGTAQPAPVNAHAAPIPPAAPAAKSPSGDDVGVLPIDLSTALRLADTSNPTIAFARERVREAYAHLREAEVLWLPSLHTGPAYLRHDGLLQNSRGELFPVSKWNFFEGGGAGLSLETADAVFAPLVARRIVQAQTAAAQGVTDRIQLDVAIAYLELLRAYGALAISDETLANARYMLKTAETFDKAGIGRTPADVTRARAEVELRRQERADLEGQVGIASARLTQLLLFDPTVDLRPIEPAVVPIALVAMDVPLDELVATGLLNRPELAESRALVEAALARWRQARVSPLLPRLEVAYFAGEFGGGLNDRPDRFSGRGDGLAQAIWTLHNFGAGDIAHARASRSQYNQANFRVAEVQAQIGAEVAGAAKEVRARQRALESAPQAIRQAEETWRRIVKFTEGFGLRRAVLTEAVDMLLAEQALHQARMQYLAEVIEYNEAQFRLYWALGQPPLEALPKAVTLPVKVPVTPPAPPPGPAVPSAK